MEAAVDAFPWTLPIGLFSLATGRLISKSGTYLWAVRYGFTITFIGVTYLSFLSDDTKTWQWVIITLCSGVGLGILFPGLAYATQAPVSGDDRPVAAGMYSFVRTLGQLLGVSISSSAFQHALVHNLRNFKDLAEVATQVGSQAISIIPHLSTSLLHEEIVESYVQSLRFMWIVNSVVVGVALVLCCQHIEDITLEQSDTRVIEGRELPSPVSMMSSAG
jgi:MFS family permease